MEALPTMINAEFGWRKKSIDIPSKELTWLKRAIDVEEHPVRLRCLKITFMKPFNIIFR